MNTTEQNEQSIQSTEREEDQEEQQSPESNELDNNENLPAIPSEVDTFSLTDALDDDIITDELKNRAVNHWVYAFKQDGKMVSNLSKAGVDACCVEMAKKGNIIEESPVVFTLDPTSDEHVLFVCTATRYVVENGARIKMETVNGAKRQHTKMYTKSKGFVPDPFWFEKGAMKAARNARNRLIPEEIRVMILALAKQKDRVRNITPEDAERVHTGNTKERNDVTQNVTYATGVDKKFIEAWIGENIGKGEAHRKLFKYWVNGFPTPMIGENDKGELTLNKLDMRLVNKIRKSPDDARESFNEWWQGFIKVHGVSDPQEAAKILGGEIVNAKTAKK